MRCEAKWISDNVLRVCEALSVAKGFGERERPAYPLGSVAIKTSTIGISGDLGFGMTFLVLRSTMRSNCSSII